MDILLIIVGVQGVSWFWHLRRKRDYVVSEEQSTKYVLCKGFETGNGMAAPHFTCEGILVI